MIGAGVTSIEYTILSPVVGGVHSMVTVELVVPFIKLISLTLLGRRPELSIVFPWNYDQFPPNDFIDRVCANYVHDV